MVDRNKKTKICDKASQEEEEGISQLPDLLISNNILSHLSTKDAVRTSVLSTKWGNRWKLIPGLDLDSRAFLNVEAFVNFVDRFLDSQKESWILKLKLSIHDSDDGTKSHLGSWIDAVTKRKIEELDVCFDDDSTDGLLKVIPVSIYTSETLVTLRLCGVTLVNAEFVSLSCLKMMLLSCVRYPNTATVEKLISGSPVLEDLTVVESPRGVNVIQVRSQTVKRIDINAFCQFVIDAPLLQCLNTYIFKHKNFKIISSGFPDKVDINVISTLLDKPLVSEILTDISKVRELVIHGNMWRGISRYSRSEPLVQFSYLSSLNATYYNSDLELLPTLLESCPNLQSLRLVGERGLLHQRDEKEPNVIFSTVPRCLVSSLKFVVWFSEFDIEMELVRYFLKNSAILEDLSLYNYDTKKAKYDDILEEILAMPKCSSACEIFIFEEVKDC